MLESPLSTHSFILPGESDAISGQFSPGTPVSLQHDSSTGKVNPSLNPCDQRNSEAGDGGMCKVMPFCCE
jgi:hypothetical protein